MNKYQYKEKKYAEEILSNGFISKYVPSELKILAKYYRSQGNDEVQIKDLLKQFCDAKLKGYNEAVHFKIINSAVKFAMNDKNKLVQIDEIEITNKELEAINEMDICHDYKRVVFTLLVLNKLNKKFLEIRDGELKSDEHYFGGHSNYRELVSVAKITFNKTKKSNVKNIHDLIHILDEKEIVEITNNGNIKLLFMYGIEENGDAVFTVDDYMVIGLYYDLHYGANRVKKCETKDCNTLIKSTGKNQKYCENCGDAIEKEKTRKRVQKYRNSTM